MIRRVTYYRPLQSLLLILHSLQKEENFEYQAHKDVHELVNYIVDAMHEICGRCIRLVWLCILTRSNDLPQLSIHTCIRL